MVGGASHVLPRRAKPYQESRRDSGSKPKVVPTHRDYFAVAFIKDHQPQRGCGFWLLTAENVLVTTPLGLFSCLPRMFDRHESLFDGQIESFDEIVGDDEPGLVDVGILNRHNLVLCAKDGSKLGVSDLTTPGAGFEARGVTCPQRGFDFVEE